MKYQLEREQYARIYGSSPRSVSNYERDEAPLDDPEAMYHWLWKRRTQPAGFTGKTLEEIVADYARVTARGEDLSDPVRQKLRDYLDTADGAQNCLRCVLVGAQQRDFMPEYRKPIFAAANKIHAAIEEAYTALGLDYHEGVDDDEDDPADDAPAENVVPMPAQTSASVRTAHA